MSRITSVTNKGNKSNIVGIINSVLTPYMLNPGEWDWSNFTGFFWVRNISLCPSFLSSSPFPGSNYVQCCGHTDLRFACRVRT